jgi:PAS domain S-box-containing protein
VKVAEVMQPLKSADGFTGVPGLDAAQDILLLDPARLAALPAVVPVRGPGGAVVGSADRDTLAFIRSACRDWLLASFLDHCPEGVIAIDRDARIFYVNDAYCRILGVAKHHALGKNLRVIEPGTAMITVLDTGRPIVGKAVRVKTVGRDVSVYIHPVERHGELAAVVSIFRDITETKLLSQELDKAKGLADYFRRELERKEGIAAGFRAIIGQHPLFLKVLSEAAIVARTDAPVLLCGENGVGKEIIAKAIHYSGSRSGRPLIIVNCAAIPESLLESELFGYEEGSFTGAKRGGKMGKFKLADGGTIFLDEVGDMSPSMQSKLLRVLQDKEIETIGRTHSVPVDVRVIAATNRNLAAMVKQGLFRSDLYYRLNVVYISIPPLRERGDDIGLLADHFLAHSNAKYNKQLVLSAAVRRFFARHPWPCNVRELQNCIEYAVIMCPEKEIGLGHLPGHLGARQEGGEEAGPPPSVPAPWRDVRQAAEKELIQQALAACGNNKTQAMKTLGISRRAFYRKLRAYGLRGQR